MDEQPQPKGGIVKRPPGATGGITRGFARPEAPTEVKLAQYRTAMIATPAVVLGGAIAFAAWSLSQAIQASPNAQMIQALREKDAQQSEQIKEIARNSGCNWTLVCFANEEDKPKFSLPKLPQPRQAPDYYQSQPVAATQVQDIDNPAMALYWSSRWHHIEFVGSATEVCERDGWLTPECLALAEVWNEVNQQQQLY